MRHTISVLVENTFGVLTRVAGMFSGRGYNIDSLNVAPTDDPSVSRVTLVTSGSDWAISQLNAQLAKLVNAGHTPCQLHPGASSGRVALAVGEQIEDWAAARPVTEQTRDPLE